MTLNHEACECAVAELIEHATKEMAKWDIVPSAADKFAWEFIAKCALSPRFHERYENDKLEKKVKHLTKQNEKLKRALGDRPMAFVCSTKGVS